MEIIITTHKPARTTFKDLKEAAVFRYRGNFFMKAWTNRGVRLSTGETMTFPDSEPVVACKAYVTITPDPA